MPGDISFRDVHVSGAKADRAQLRRLLDQLEADDVLMVTRLDRLARSTRDLLNTLAPGLWGRAAVVKRPAYSRFARRLDAASMAFSPWRRAPIGVSNNQRGHFYRGH